MIQAVSYRQKIRAFPPGYFSTEEEQLEISNVQRDFEREKASSVLWLELAFQVETAVAQ